jgi:hypothetical protein
VGFTIKVLVTKYQDHPVKVCPMDIGKLFITERPGKINTGNLGANVGRQWSDFHDLYPPAAR